MQFNKNKNTYIHGWYPFVEGYSKEFIRDIINELPYTPQLCLEPFAGSGTTPVELQKLNIKCASFEVNPFMYNLASTKMRTDYTVHSFNKAYEVVELYLNNPIENIEEVITPPAYGKITEKENLEKWNFNLEVLKGILDVKYAISMLGTKKYQNLFKIALASILLDVSNLYRNGKCLSYKADWKTKVQFTREQVGQLFLSKLRDSILSDIRRLNKYKRDEGKLLSNFELCKFGDCREEIEGLTDGSVDLVITSPPYLNSRDYTDTYMVELWMLDHITDYESLRQLRRKTLRSHVQVKWGELDVLNIEELRIALDNINEHKDKFWNDEIPSMIKGYFEDLDTLFRKLYTKMKDNGRIYFNVANSAYYGVEIKTDQIVAEIARNNGFRVLEIRKARKIKPSVQQKEQIPYLLEVVIVIIKEAL